MNAGMLKNALLAALAVFALAFGLVAFHAKDTAEGLIIVTRFDDALMAALIAFLASIIHALLHQGRALAALALSVALTCSVLLGMIDDVTWLLPFDAKPINAIIIAIGGVFALRAAWALRHSGASLETIEEREKIMDELSIKVQRAAVYLGPLFVVIALILPLLPFADRHLLDVAILVLTYIMLGWGLNIVVGLAGLLDLGYVAFYAVGAYSYALLAQHFGLGFWICLPLAGLMAAFAGILLGFPVLRLRGDYLAIVTLGFGEMVRIILTNWQELTNGPNGISGIPRPSFFGLPFKHQPAAGEATFHGFFNLAYSPVHRIIFLYYLILAMALFANFFTMRIRKLPIGRAWEALREDEAACLSLGINPRNVKLTAFAIGAMFAGFGGSFFATRQGFISPESFTFHESAIILAIVVVGGMGSQLGVALASILLIGIPEFFRELHQYRMLAFGCAMVLIMLWRPAGLLAHREPTIKLSVEH